MPQVMVVARNFMDMVAALPASKLDTLYDSAFICEAVLRSKINIFCSALFVLTAFLILVQLAMEEWVLDEYATKHRVAIDKLLQLRVFVEVRDRRKELSYKMNQKFQGNMQKYLVDGGSLPREPIPLSVTGRLPTSADLEAYALDQWEVRMTKLNSEFRAFGSVYFPYRRLIHIFSIFCGKIVLLVAIDQFISSRKRDKFQLLHDEDISAWSSEFKVPSSYLVVTASSQLIHNQHTSIFGSYCFLCYQLMETNAQLWYIMREYISSAEERGVDPTELISFLLELSFHKLGAAYSLSTLTDVQRIAIRDLAELGLVKLQQGFVVVETNFRMYAYSTSKLHCEILRLFSRVEYQLPNLIVGAITKESIYGAFENGITAEQIISFLKQNAHPRVADKIPTVPENVSDQIRLWETDRNRVDMIPSHLYEDFPSKPPPPAQREPRVREAMAGKKRKSGSEKQPKHRLPLGADADAVADASKRRRSGAAKQHQADEEASIPSSLSAKILREARKQQQEEMLADASDEGPSAAGPSTSSAFPVPAADDDEDDDVDEFDGFDALSEYDGGEVEINEEDEKALAAFMSKDKAAELTLGDIILQKIREKDAEVSTEGRPRVKLDNSIIELYKEVGKFLSRYTSGKIPKAFKRIPSLECWAEERNCTLREAVIIGSIIQKVSIPFLHASVALVKLAEMEYCGTTSYFIKLFLDKKYALPYRALDAVLAHFMRFLDDERIMPVIWHQSLLAFVERYKNELEKKDKEKLARLLDHQKHYLVATLAPSYTCYSRNSKGTSGQLQQGSRIDICLILIISLTLCSYPHLSPLSPNLLKKISGTYQKCQWRRISVVQIFIRC
ncbi:RNA polymerase II transcription factor B subunit 2 [Dichanthelium oligosanthes]|uniref:RNA polymerase II transcription factor B subunit 2 n=1 Tax=Dichanthelium oligosanthes TaxID=888268 RepID=A0A1E5UVF5_9POAL|nr:RNA polymerase II transcription factor B subunit 2 [Dichanthelium oligosanthes]